MQWITITNSGSRTGNDSVNFTVARNTGAARERRIRVGGQVFSISQSAPQCRYQLSADYHVNQRRRRIRSVTRDCGGQLHVDRDDQRPWISIVGAQTEQATAASVSPCSPIPVRREMAS
jgi:hypothetical protein